MKKVDQKQSMIIKRPGCGDSNVLRATYPNNDSLQISLIQITMWYFCFCVDKEYDKNQGGW